RTPLMRGLDREIVRGAGPGGLWSLESRGELDSILRAGARHVVESSGGTQRDLDRCEDAHASDSVDTSTVSARARDRGQRQLGSLGSGNHFLEVRAVDEVFDDRVGRAFGLR